MSRLSRTIRTRPRLWAGIALAAFVLLGFVNWLPESKGSVPVWDQWAWTIKHGDWELVHVTLGCTLFIAVLAAGIGWLGQSIVGGILAAVLDPTVGNTTPGEAGPAGV